MPFSSDEFQSGSDAVEQISSSCQGLAIFLRWSEDDASRLHAFRKAVKVVLNGIGKAGE